MNQYIQIFEEFKEDDLSISDLRQLDELGLTNELIKVSILNEVYDKLVLISYYFGIAKNTNHRRDVNSINLTVPHKHIIQGRKIFFFNIIVSVGNHSCSMYIRRNISDFKTQVIRNVPYTNFKETVNNIYDNILEMMEEYKKITETFDQYESIHTNI